MIACETVWGRGYLLKDPEIRYCVRKITPNIGNLQSVYHQIIQS
jgi:hypothetical protein